MEATQKVICSLNIPAIQKMADNSVDSIVTDAPYGLGDEPNAALVLKDWVEHGYHEITKKGGGFMGKEWDSFVPQPIFWKEVFRVLKPGGHILCFFSARTYDWGVMAMRLGGFEIRDCIQWLYGSAMPKGINISKSLVKSNVTGVTKWDGWNTALKPSYEPIVLARKPIDAGLTIAQNILKWGVGAINIDACRINESIGGGRSRFPANVILDEEAGQALDTQAGVRKSGAMTKSYAYKNDGFSFGKATGATKSIHGQNEGGASRFFYCPKASQSERNKGLESGMRNKHPTVKPVSLCRYLVRLITPVGGLCVDPFYGSGGIGIACKIENINCIGIEASEEDCIVSESRVAAWDVEKL